MKEINCTIKLTDSEYEDLEKMIEWLNSDNSNSAKKGFWNEHKYINNRFIAGLLEDVRLFLK